MTENDFNKPLSLSIDPKQLERFCQQLLKRSRNTAKTHDALVTLETFLVRFGQAQVGSKAYQEIEDLINSYTEQTRELLLKEKTDELISALKACDATAIAAIHEPLSRNGFYQILQTAAVSQLEVERQKTKTWASNWLSDAKYRAEQASGYPDAMDFKKANICIKEYQAMLDVERYFSSI